MFLLCLNAPRKREFTFSLWTGCMRTICGDETGQRQTHTDQQKQSRKHKQNQRRCHRWWSAEDDKYQDIMVNYGHQRFKSIQCLSCIGRRRKGGAHWRWSIFNSSVVYVLHVCECTVFVCVPCVSPVKGINPEQYIWYAHRGFYKGDNRRQNPRRCIYNSLITLTAFIFTIFIAYL